MPKMPVYTEDKYIIPDNYLYISHLDEEFQFWRIPVTPETINDSMSANFQSTNALGRSAPVYTYSNSGPRTVQISLKLHRDMMDAINIGVSNSELKEGEDYVENLINALQAIAVPKYTMTNKAIEPPMVALRIANQIFIKGVIAGSIGVTYSLPILSNGKYAVVDITLTVSEVDPYTASEVLHSGGFRGVVQTLKNGMGLSVDEEN